jgi:peptidoglycan biosynthesis protein MviN/MurJ (putative lipid II flippase)
VNRRVTDTAVAAGFALAGFAVILAPALFMRVGILDAGVGSVDDDILIASVLVGLVHAVLAWYRLRDKERTRQRRAHVWIASLDALVVLALSASLLLLAVLISFPDELVSLGNRGFTVVTMWAAIQLVAVLLAETTARVVFWWLEPREGQSTSAARSRS